MLITPGESGGSGFPRGRSGFDERRLLPFRVLDRHVTVRQSELPLVWRRTVIQRTTKLMALILAVGVGLVACQDMATTGPEVM